MQSHPQEALLEQAQAWQQSAAYDEYRAQRVEGEYRLAGAVGHGRRYVVQNAPLLQAIRNAGR